MKNILLILCFIFMISLSANGESSIKLNLSSDRDTYILGESIPVSIDLINTNVDEIEIRDDLFFGFYSNFTTINPKGKQLKQLSDFDMRISSLKKWIPISKSNSTIKEIDLTDIYTQPYEPNYPHTFDQEGIYEIVYSGNTATRELGSDNILWEGVITSNSLKIRLVLPSENDLLNAYEDLTNSKTSKKARLHALNKIRYAKVSRKDAPKVLESVIKNSDSEEAIQILRVLKSLANNDSFNVIKKLLQKEQNPFVRAEAMDALKVFDTNETRQLLIDECEKRRERSYRAAIVVLGDIGDIDSIAILEDIAETDDLKWVRERSLESITKIRNRLELLKDIDK